jgi:hypothetical protein
MLLLSIVAFANAQGGKGMEKYHKNSGNVRISRPLGISGNIGGGCIAGVSADYFVLPQLNFEAGFGFSQYAAVKYHFFGGDPERNWSPFIGAAYCIPTFVGDEGYREGLGFFAFPLGVHYISDRGFSFSIAVSMVLYENSYWNSAVIPWGGIRIGYHF